MSLQKRHQFESAASLKWTRSRVRSLLPSVAQHEQAFVDPALLRKSNGLKQDAATIHFIRMNVIMGSELFDLDYATRSLR
jgi:hypothetical protein